MSRKILYSPGYGAGWTTWGGSTKEEKLFMLEYKPFIKALESKKKIDEKLKERFKRDWVKKFPNSDEPYMDGLSNLTICEVEDGVRVRVKEYDGYESVDVEGHDDEGWL